MEDATDAERSGSVRDLPGTVRGRFDWSETEPAVAVVETVAVATDQSPLDVYELHDVIDCDALNRLFQNGPATTDVDLQVSVPLAGCEVTVRCDGLVRADIVDGS